MNICMHIPKFIYSFQTMPLQGIYNNNNNKNKNKKKKRKRKRKRKRKKKRKKKKKNSSSSSSSNSSSIRSVRQVLYLVYTAWRGIAITHHIATRGTTLY